MHRQTHTKQKSRFKTRLTMTLNYVASLIFDLEERESYKLYTIMSDKEKLPLERKRGTV